MTDKRKARDSSQPEWWPGQGYSPIPSGKTPVPPTEESAMVPEPDEPPPAREPSTPRPSKTPPGKEKK